MCVKSEYRKQESLPFRSNLWIRFAVLLLDEYHRAIHCALFVLGWRIYNANRKKPKKTSSSIYSRQWCVCFDSVWSFVWRCDFLVVSNHAVYFCAFGFRVFLLHNIASIYRSVGYINGAGVCKQTTCQFYFVYRVLVASRSMTHNDWSMRNARPIDRCREKERIGDWR